MPSIPLKENGAPDWNKFDPEDFIGCTDNAGRLTDHLILECVRDVYIAALERCAEWHRTKAKESAEAHSFWGVAQHREAIATFQRWIEEAKK